MEDGIYRRIAQRLVQANPTAEELELQRRMQEPEFGGDQSYQDMADEARRRGLRAPWHRDFSEPPGSMGGDRAPSGRMRPLQRPDICLPPPAPPVS